MGVWLKRKLICGFTLVELMITLAVVVLLSVVAGMNIASRMRVSNLESAVQSMTADLSAARSLAMFQGCPTRLVFCQDRLCSTMSSSVVNGLVGLVTPARYYGFLRMSSASGSGAPCENANFIGANSMQYWSFDRRPQSIPAGVAFTAIYNTNTLVPGTDDWSSTVSTNALNSIWWDSNYGLLTPNASQAMAPPITAPNVLSPSGASATTILQMQVDNCTPHQSGSDCPAFILMTSSGGNFDYAKCSSGGRVDGGNTCY